jgi:Uma2 family endonuclease
MAALFRTPPKTIRADHDLEHGFLLNVPTAAHTLAGFRAWALSDHVPEKLPVTFIRGEIFIDMSKEEIRSHSLVKTEVGGVLANLNNEVDLGHVYFHGVLVSNLAAKLSHNPDLMVISFSSLDAGRVRYIKDKGRIVEIEGSPDMVAEIVSDSSMNKDTRDLRVAYHRAGIREYWIIDARGADIRFQILHWRKSGYVAVPRADGWQRSRVFYRCFQLIRSKDRRGGWRYQLATKTE